MPKENKKRGRREEKKRKRDQEDEELDVDARNRKSRRSGDDVAPVRPSSNGDVVEGVTSAGGGEAAFYGLLDEEEQEYFRRADEMLELDQFNDPEERKLFLDNLHKEIEGKELKIAHSQGCSRLMEKLIQLATPAQLRNLFQKFSGHFLPIVQHRFASHCCEALFLHSAPIVTQEMRRDQSDAEHSDPNDIYVTMENLFLFAANELEGNLGYLITDRYASHTLRVLLVVLAGLPIDGNHKKTLLHSKKKESNAMTSVDKAKPIVQGTRAVPQSFLDETQTILTKSVSGLDTTNLRSLAKHEIGNPMLQLLLQLELSTFGKQKAKDGTSIFRRLLPEDEIKEGTESEQFLNDLVYHQVGSRLIEKLVEHAPGKSFKALYRGYFRNRIGSLARNDIAGYVVCKVLERLSQEDLADATALIIPQLPSLVERGRTAVIKTLVERSVVRGADTEPLATALESSYSGVHGFEIARLLRLSEAGSETTASTPPSMTKFQSRQPITMPERLHSSLLAQSMLSAPGSLSALVFDSLARLSTPLSLALARDPNASRTLQAALKSPEASVIFRRKMIQRFYGHIGEMALDPSASHVIDAIWAGTTGLAFIRERIAEEIAENEAALRESFVGRNVWRNWEMDLYKRRRETWVSRSRAGAGNDGFMGFPNEKSESTSDVKENTKKHKSALDLARERHFAEKKKKETDKKLKERKQEEMNGTEKAASTKDTVPQQQEQSVV